MSSPNSSNSLASSETFPEVAETLSNLQEKNTELRRVIALLTQENVQCRARHEELKQRLNHLVETLEKNARVFGQLYDNTSNALQIARTPILESPRINEKKTSLAKNTSVEPECSSVVQPIASTSKETRQRLHLEPISLEKLQQQVDADLPENNEETLQENLSTIIEENSSALNETRQPWVRLSRLPSAIMDSHLNNKNSVLETSLEDNLNNISLELALTSTPSKLETMKNLGLVPRKKTLEENFITSRRKRSRSISEKKSPKHEKTPPKKSTEKNLVKKFKQSPKTPPEPKKIKTSNNLTVKTSERSKTDKTSESKKTKLSPPMKIHVTRDLLKKDRPERKAKPQHLKEGSLRT